MTRVINTPDGISFPVEDNATPEQINAAIKQIKAAKAAGQTQTNPVATNPEDVRDARGMPGGTPAPAEPPKGMIDTIMNDYVPAVSGAVEPTARVGGFGARGIGLGAASILGLPVDLMNISPMIFNLLPGEQGATPFSDYPLFGSQMNRDIYKGGMNAIHDLYSGEPIRWEPETGPERIASRIGEEVGANIVPAAGVLGKAGRVGVEGARKMTTPIVKDMVESAAVNPRNFIQKEAYISGAAGTGAAAADEAANQMGYEPGTRGARIADLFGSVAGVGAATVGAGGVSGLVNLVKALSRTKNYSDRLVRETVTDTLANAAQLPKASGAQPDTEALVRAIEQNPKVSDDIPGVVESLADRTRNPGLAALEYQRQSGPNSGMFHQHRMGNAAAINAALEGNKPGGPAAALSTELLGERARRLATLQQTEQAASQAAAAGERGLQPRLIAEERGHDIRGSLETARDASWNEVRQAWEPINQSMEQIDLTPLADTYRRATEALSEAERRTFAPPEAGIPEQLSRVEPPQPTGLLDARGNPIMSQPAPPARNIREVTGLRSVLTTKIAQAMDKPGGANEARILRGYVEEIDGFLDNNIPTNLRQQYDAARQLRVTHGDRFEQPQTAVAQTLAEKRGQPAMPASVVPRKFVQSDQGRVSDFQHLIREAGTDPRALGAVRDQLRQVIADRGLMRHPEEIDNFVQQYGTVLQRFPEITTELRTAGQQQIDRTFAERATGEFGAQHGTQATPTQPGTSGTSAPGKYMAYGDAQQKQAMKGVIAAKDPAAAADELLNFANNAPDAVQGARRAFWDVMEEQARSKGGTTADIATGEQPWLKAQLREFMKDPRNKAVMDRLWRDNPEQVENIEIITRAMQGLDTRLSAKAPSTSGTAQSVLPSPETISSRALAWQRGQVGLTWIITSLGTMVGRKVIKGAQRDAIERFTDKALLDPDFAKLLFKENNPANRAALKVRAKTWLGPEANNIINMLSGEEEQDDIHSAITRGHGDTSGKRGPLEITVNKPAGVQ